MVEPTPGSPAWTGHRKRTTSAWSAADAEAGGTHLRHGGRAGRDGRLDRRQVWRVPPRTFRWRSKFRTGRLSRAHGPGFAVYAINRSSSTGPRRFSPAAPRTTASTPASSPTRRGRPHHFRRIARRPVVIELRAWSRISRNSPGTAFACPNRCGSNCGATTRRSSKGRSAGRALVPRPWATAPTPAKARRIQRRTSRACSSATGSGGSRPTNSKRSPRPAIAVAPGTTEAAVAHIRSAPNASARTAPTRRRQAGDRRWIDVLADREDSGSGQPGGQRDVTVLSSMPGVGQAVLATLLAEAPQALARRDYKAVAMPHGRSARYTAIGQVQARRAPHGRPRPPSRRSLPLGAGRGPAHPSARQVRRPFAGGHGECRPLRSVSDRCSRLPAHVRTTCYRPHAGGKKCA